MIEKLEIFKNIKFKGTTSEVEETIYPSEKDVVNKLNELIDAVNYLKERAQKQTKRETSWEETNW